MDKDLAEALEKYLARWLEEISNNKNAYHKSYRDADELRQVFLEDLDENIINQFADGQDWDEFFVSWSEKDDE